MQIFLEARQQHYMILLHYLGGMDFMLLPGSSKTLGQASGVTEM